MAAMSLAYAPVDGGRYPWRNLPGWELPRQTTRRGNSNPYGQHNEATWFDWSLSQRHSGLVDVVARLAALRAFHLGLRAENVYGGEEIVRFGAGPTEPDWNGPINRLGFMVCDLEDSLRDA